MSYLLAENLDIILGKGFALEQVLNLLVERVQVRNVKIFRGGTHFVSNINDYMNYLSSTVLAVCSIMV